MTVEERRSQAAALKSTDTDISVVILTYNEERNIETCIRSARRLTPNIFVVDSFSTDTTLAIADEMGVPLVQHAWVHWADQRNWAMETLPIATGWVLFLDADETLTDELVEEMRQAVRAAPAGVNGFYARRRFVFLGRWLRHGGYASIWVLRLVRQGQARVLPAAGAEYFEVRGKVERLKHDMIHDDRKPLSAWIAKHDQVASMEAAALSAPRSLSTEGDAEVEGSVRYRLRALLYDRLPGWMVPFLIFTYRYVIRLGFLDGPEGFAYYFLHELWYPFLIGIKRRELDLQASRNPDQRDENAPAGDGFKAGETW